MWAVVDLPVESPIRVPVNNETVPIKMTEKRQRQEIIVMIVLVLLSNIVVTLPVSHLDRSELKADA